MASLGSTTSLLFAIVLIALARSSVGQPPSANFLWIYEPSSGAAGTLNSLLTPSVWVVTIEGNLAGLDLATGKQRWAIDADGLQYCPSQQVCYFANTPFQYDNTTDLVFVVLGAEDANTVSVLAITSATGAVNYSVSVPVGSFYEDGTLFLETTTIGQVYLWDSYLGVLHAFNVTNGDALWSSNATNPQLCYQAASNVAGVATGPRGITITFCGIYSYWAWDSHGHVMWTNPGYSNDTDTWYYAPLFLSDGSFLIWKEESVGVSLCRYAMSSNSFSLSWCSQNPPTPYVWAASPVLLLPNSSAVSLSFDNDVSDLVVAPQSFSTVGGVVGWGGAPVANYSNEGYPMAWSPAVDPSGAHDF